ncbi:amidohydrolase family protein [Mariniblastus sp.]|nr:amidohydrolase family protein [Mariniblastus sp.]MDA7879812.1 amidohydrolase family protein [Mariniblastus sp.]MDA7925054.1 amidohydrolase family protein [Mariniblastus sp.]MDB4372397.1 amidohydrolase family protein [Mariniblastus sp.]
MYARFAFWLSFIVIIHVCCPLKAQLKVDTVIVGGHFFDVDSGKFEPNISIAIAKGRFAAVGKKPESLNAKKTLILGDDDFILPGLIDCHAHYNVRLIKKRREEFEFMPLVYLANGATVTFSCGEFDPQGMMSLRKRIENGEQIGPRLVNSGPYFGRARPGWRGKKPEQEIRDEVDFWADRGVGGFKAKSIDPDSLRTLIDQAHKHNLTVTGHLDSGYRNSVNPKDAIDMGIDRIEHFLGGDGLPNSQSAYQSLQNLQPGTPAYHRIVKHFIDNEVYFDATLTAYGYLGETTPETHEEYQYWFNENELFTPHMQELVKKTDPPKGMEIYQRIYRVKQTTIGPFHAAGGLITLGTDHVSNGNHLPGFGIHREMDILVRSGISPSETLKIATINGARALKIDKDHGSIEKNKSGDLVILKANPLENIRNTRKISHVIKAGVIHNPVKLLDSVKGKIGPANQEQESDW